MVVTKKEITPELDQNLNVSSELILAKIGSKEL